jgi:hypothetical protein
MQEELKEWAESRLPLTARAMNTLIADIKRNSLDDGPGYPYARILQGCP